MCFKFLIRQIADGSEQVIALGTRRHQRIALALVHEDDSSQLPCSRTPRWSRPSARPRPVCVNRPGCLYPGMCESIIDRRTYDDGRVDLHHGLLVEEAHTLSSAGSGIRARQGRVS